MSRLGVLLWSLLLLLGASPAQGDWIRDLRGDVSYEDNLSNSNRAADERDDFSFAGHASFGRFGELTDDLRLTVTADLDARAFARYDDFNSLTISSTAALRYRFGLGAMAPFVRIEASGGYAAFQQSLQSGGRFRTEITFGKRLTERFALDASYSYDEIGGEIRVFDRFSHAFALNASLDLTERTRLSAGYELRSGEVVSYAVPPRPDIVALANDRRTVNTFGSPYVAYNFDATTNSLSLGVSQALTQSLSLDARYEWHYTTRSHLSYTNNVLRLSIHTAF
ncbi:MAG TPA: hypothetical protein VGL24_06260 [Chthoniobacterales bacterium]